MRTRPPIHPLKANKHGVKKEIPATIVLPLTCFPPTRLNSMKRREYKTGKKKSRLLATCEKLPPESNRPKSFTTGDDHIQTTTTTTTATTLDRQTDRLTLSHTCANAKEKKRIGKKRTAEEKKVFFFFSKKRSCSL
jgi:hypothetical protein